MRRLLLWTVICAVSRIRMKCSNKIRFTKFSRFEKYGLWDLTYLSRGNRSVHFYLWLCGFLGRIVREPRFQEYFVLRPRVKFWGWWIYVRIKPMLSCTRCLLVWEFTYRLRQLWKRKMQERNNKKLSDFWESNAYVVCSSQRFVKRSLTNTIYSSIRSSVFSFMGFDALQVFPM